MRTLVSNIKKGSYSLSFTLLLPLRIVCALSLVLSVFVLFAAPALHVVMHSSECKIYQKKKTLKMLLIIVNVVLVVVVIVTIIITVILIELLFSLLLLLLSVSARLDMISFSCRKSCNQSKSKKNVIGQKNGKKTH